MVRFDSEWREGWKPAQEIWLAEPAAGCYLHCWFQHSSADWSTGTTEKEEFFL